ncbi:MAG: hypothetical protein EXQ58_00030 [Acidobacteria bacterium]|nr:hypothetical protein [Acidobacteriota bacterium]
MINSSRRDRAGRRQFLLGGGLATASVALKFLDRLSADESQKARPNSRIPRSKKLLLIGGPFDGHPKGTHEYMAGLRVISQCLETVEGLQVKITNSEKSWSEGPGMIDSADGILLFREQGAKWMQGDADRLAAFERLARRGGGCAALHFGMGTIEAGFIKRFVNSFGACHGGPDRRHYTLTIKAAVAKTQHPVCRGIGDFQVHDEFYYRLKFVEPVSEITPLIQADIEGRVETVCWAWQRGDGGRSFGFSGLHYHENWRLLEYRRLVTQGILWTLKLPIPKDGVNVDVTSQI